MAASNKFCDMKRKDRYYCNEDAFIGYTIHRNQVSAKLRIHIDEYVSQLNDMCMCVLS